MWWASKNWCPPSGYGFPTVSPRKPSCSLPEAQISLRPRGSTGFHGEKLCWPPCNYGCLAKCCNWWGWNCGDGPKQEDFATYLIFPSQNTTLRFSSPLYSVFWTEEHQMLGWFSASFPTEWSWQTQEATVFTMHADRFLIRNENTTSPLWTRKTFNISHKSTSRSCGFLLRFQLHTLQCHFICSFTQFNLPRYG